MEQFNLQGYINNPLRKVVTGDGKPVRIICTNAKSDYPIIGLVEEEDIEIVRVFKPNGIWHEESKSFSYNLFFAPENKDGWINVYEPDEDSARTGSLIFKSKEEAIRCIGRDDYVGTIHIEW